MVNHDNCKKSKAIKSIKSGGIQAVHGTSHLRTHNEYRVRCLFNYSLTCLNNRYPPFYIYKCNCHKVIRVELIWTSGFGKAVADCTILFSGSFLLFAGDTANGVVCVSFVCLVPLCFDCFSIDLSASDITV